MSQLNEYDDFIHDEMMTHPALFTHPKPKHVIIFDDHSNRLLQQALKHSNLESIWQIETNLSEPQQKKLNDPRIVYYQNQDWQKKLESNHFDIIIATSAFNLLSADIYQLILQSLSKNGLLIQQCETQFRSHLLKEIYQLLKTVGFKDLQILHFPQPSLQHGCGAALLAFKNLSMKRIREKDIYNRDFKTRYYNLDMHKAALALPEFIRDDLNELA